MSIWAIWLAFDADQEHGETRPYFGSHVMPRETDTGGPPFDIAAIARMRKRAPR